MIKNATNRRLVVIGCMLFAVGLVIQQHHAVADPWVGAPTKIVVTPPPALPPLKEILHRDPFAPPKGANTSQSTSPSGTPSLATGVSPIYGSNIPRTGQNIPPLGSPLVPGIGSPLSGANGPATTIALLGTIRVGNKEAALISEGTQTEVVSVGAVIGGKRISQIVSQGIIFADGSRLGMSPRLPGSSVYVQPQNVVPAPIPSPSASPQVRINSNTPPPYYRPAPVPYPFSPPTSGPPPVVNPSPYPMGTP